MNYQHVQEYRWLEIRDIVKAINPDLAAIIDGINPSDELSLFQVSYPYGTKIIDDGIFHLPNENSEYVPINHPSLNDEICKELHYNAHPCGIVLSKKLELYQEFDQRITPFSLLTPGSLFGHMQAVNTPLSFHAVQTWQLSAGARSIFMLPKITDTSSHKRLEREFSLYNSKPKNLMDQWQVFRQIAKHANFSDPWTADVILFSNKWFDEAHNPNINQFQHFLLTYSWQQTEYWRNQYVWDMTFSRIQEHRNLKPNPYLTDTAKHIFAVANGALPGFTIAPNDEAAPVSAIQSIYKDIYGMKHYAPVMMHCHQYNHQDPNDSVYYSLQLPTALEFSPKSRNLSSQMHNLQELKHILDISLGELKKGQFEISKTPINEMINSIEFTYFHSEHDKYQAIHHCADLLNEPAFANAHKAFAPLTLSENSPFIRGCVKIGQKSANSA